MEYKTLPDLKHLATLKLVVELGGVAKAAKAMHIGQPAVTKRLRALDQCYGIELMGRRGRRLELTAAGQKVYTYARLMADHQASLIQDLEYLRAGHNTLRLEVTFAIGEHMLPELLLRFANKYPLYRIETRMGYSRRIQTRLATGLSDLALLEQAPDHPDVSVEKWLDDDIVLVCGINHPLANSHTIRRSQLADLQFVLREARSSMRLVLDKTLRNAGILKIPIAMEVGSIDTIVQMLQHGQYVSFLPRFAVVDALQRGALFQVNVDGLSISRTLWIARTSATLNSPAAEAFIQLLKGS